MLLVEGIIYKYNKIIILVRCVNRNEKSGIMDRELLALLNQEIGKKNLSISQISEILGVDRSIFNKFIN